MTCPRVFELDGERFSTRDGFLDEFVRVLALDYGRPLRSLDAFNDILRGGFGTPEGGFVLRWRHADLSRARLGPRDFDVLVQILRTHGPGGAEAEDGVELLLQ